MDNTAAAHIGKDCAPATKDNKATGPSADDLVLLKVDALNTSFTARQRVAISWKGDTHRFDAVLEKSPGRLRLLGLGPMNSVGFVLTHTDEGIEFQNRTGQDMPFPPAYIIADVQRILYPWCSASPLQPQDTQQQDTQQQDTQVQADCIHRRCEIDARRDLAGHHAALGQDADRSSHESGASMQRPSDRKDPSSDRLTANKSHHRPQPASKRRAGEEDASGSEGDAHESRAQRRASPDHQALEVPGSSSVLTVTETTCDGALTMRRFQYQFSGNANRSREQTSDNAVESGRVSSEKKVRAEDIRVHYVPGATRTKEQAEGTPTLPAQATLVHHRLHYTLHIDTLNINAMHVDPIDTRGVHTPQPR